MAAFGDTSMYTDPDFISRIARLQNDPAALRALAMSPVDPMAAAAQAEQSAALWDKARGYYGAGEAPSMNSSVGAALSGAATGLAGYRPPLPAAVNPGHAPVAGAAQHSTPLGAPMPQRSPYNIGRLLSGVRG